MYTRNGGGTGNPVMASSTASYHTQHSQPSRMNPLLQTRYPSDQYNHQRQQQQQRQVQTGHLSSQPPISFNDYMTAQKREQPLTSASNHGKHTPQQQTNGVHRTGRISPSPRHYAPSTYNSNERQAPMAATDAQRTSKDGSSLAQTPAANRRSPSPAGGHIPRSYSQQDRFTHSSQSKYHVAHGTFTNGNASDYRASGTRLNSTSSFSSYVPQGYSSYYGSGSMRNTSVSGSENLLQNFVQMKPTFRPGGGNNTTLSKSDMKTMRNSNNVSAAVPIRQQEYDQYHNTRNEEASSRTNLSAGRRSRENSMISTTNGSSKLGRSRISNDPSKSSRPTSAISRTQTEAQRSDLQRSVGERPSSGREKAAHDTTMMHPNNSKTRSSSLRSSRSATNDVTEGPVHAKYDSGISSYDAGKVRHILYACGIYRQTM